MTKSLLILNDDAADRVRKEYGAYVKRLRKEVPDLVLVGGAVRDTLFNRPVKDLDFMTADGTARLRLQGSFRTPLRLCPGARNPTYEHHTGNLVEVLETEDRAANVLIVLDIVARVQEFPDTLSQVWFDGEHVHCLAGFAFARDELYVETNERMTPERLARLKAKYPEFGFN
ncbi:hypothetical protein ACQUFY_05945 [Robbsia andropogonis]|uniref:hypothetical protein n=1 Tax=Robbsia andropogonis TaxID=28092 RepID=UPI003D1CA2B7